MGSPQQQYARLLGFNPDTVHGWEIGDFTLTLATLKRIESIIQGIPQRPSDAAVADKQVSLGLARTLIWDLIDVCE